MDAEGRNHHRGDDQKIQKHDGGLTPSVLPKPSFASKPSTHEQAQGHGYFECKNEVGRRRSGRHENELSQQIVLSTATTRM
jgi:hypothetical protein